MGLAACRPIEMYRFILERFAAVSVSSIEAPSIAGTMNMAPAMAANFNYLGFALRDIKEGKIATMQIERASFTSNMQQAGKSDKLTGDIANVVSHEFDAPAGWCPAKLSYSQSIGRVEKAYAGWGFGDFYSIEPCWRGHNPMLRPSGCACFTSGPICSKSDLS
jgi:hypothetical protein